MKQLLYIFLVLLTLTSYSQTDTITLFTKHDCGNCKYAKARLQENNIYYKEYPLENTENAKIMLQTLSRYGYTGKMHLPIIIINNSLFHPAVKSDTSFVRISLSKAIDTIFTLQKSGKFTFGTKNYTTATEQESGIDSECEANFTTFYVVCKNVETEAEAFNFVMELRNLGYSEAGYVFYKKYYRVYNYMYFSKEKAEQELGVNREKFKISYILTLE